MAGTIIADKIQTENSFLTLNVGQTLVATINSSGILNSSGGTMIGANGSVSNTAITGVITASQLATSLNLATNNVQVASIQTATGTPAITFAANGQATLSNTALQLTGGRIQFPSTQIASDDANCLDDFEEGTWSPELRPSSGGSYDWLQQKGRYVKIGKLVTLHGFVQFGTVGSAGTGQMYIQNFPFATLNSGDLSSGSALCIGRSGGWSSVNPVAGAIVGQSGVTAAELYQRTSSTSAVTDLPASSMTSNAYLTFSITYTTNA